MVNAKYALIRVFIIFLVEFVKFAFMEGGCYDLQQTKRL